MNSETKHPRPPRVKEQRSTSAAELQRVEEYLQRAVPDKHTTATRRALLGQLGRSTAVKIKCLQCCNYERETVRLCTVITCALYPVRPYQDSSDE